MSEGDKEIDEYRDFLGEVERDLRRDASRTSQDMEDETSEAVGNIPGAESQQEPDLHLMQNMEVVGTAAADESMGEGGLLGDLSREGDSDRLDAELAMYPSPRGEFDEFEMRIAEDGGDDVEGFIGSSDMADHEVHESEGGDGPPADESGSAGTAPPEDVAEGGYTPPPKKDDEDQPVPKEAEGKGMEIAKGEVGKPKKKGRKSKSKSKSPSPVSSDSSDDSSDESEGSRKSGSGSDSDSSSESSASSDDGKVKDLEEQVSQKDAAIKKLEAKVAELTKKEKSKGRKSPEGKSSKASSSRGRSSKVSPSRSSSSSKRKDSPSRKERSRRESPRRKRSRSRDRRSRSKERRSRSRDRGSHSKKGRRSRSRERKRSSHSKEGDGKSKSRDKRTSKSHDKKRSKSASPDRQRRSRSHSRDKKATRGEEPPRRGVSAGRSQSRGRGTGRGRGFVPSRLAGSESRSSSARSGGSEKRHGSPPETVPKKKVKSNPKAAQGNPPQYNWAAGLTKNQRDNWLKEWGPKQPWEFGWKNDGIAGLLEYCIYQAVCSHQRYLQCNQVAREAKIVNFGDKYPPFKAVEYGKDYNPTLREALNQKEMNWPWIGNMILSMKLEAVDQRLNASIDLLLVKNRKNREKKMIDGKKFENVYLDTRIRDLASRAKTHFSPEGEFTSEAFKNFKATPFYPVPIGKWRKILLPGSEAVPAIAYHLKWKEDQEMKKLAAMETRQEKLLQEREKLDIDKEEFIKYYQKAMAAAAALKAKNDAAAKKRDEEKKQLVGMDYEGLKAVEAASLGVPATAAPARETREPVAGPSGVPAASVAGPSGLELFPLGRPKEVAKKPQGISTKEIDLEEARKHCEFVPVQGTSGKVVVHTNDSLRPLGLSKCNLVTLSGERVTVSRGDSVKKPLRLDLIRFDPNVPAFARMGEVRAALTPAASEEEMSSLFGIGKEDSEEGASKEKRPKTD